MTIKTHVNQFIAKSVYIVRQHKYDYKYNMVEENRKPMWIKTNMDTNQKKDNLKKRKNKTSDHGIYPKQN